MNTTNNTIDTAETESRIDLARRALQADLGSTSLLTLADLLREAAAAMDAAEKRTGYGSFGARADQARLELAKVDAAAELAAERERSEVESGDWA